MTTFGYLVETTTAMLESNYQAVLQKFCETGNYKPKTVARWTNKPIEQLETRYKNEVRLFFRALLHKRVAKVIALLQHFLVPSEICGVWFVVDDQLVCYENTQHFSMQDLNHQTWLLPLLGKGLTTLALHECRVLRLHGEGISGHRAKRFAGSPLPVNVFLVGLISQSILRVPVFENDRPVALLSFENKLKPNRFDELLGSRENRLDIFKKIKKEVLSTKIPLAEKLSVIDRKIKRVKKVKFLPDDVVAASRRKEVYSVHDADLASELSELVSSLVGEVNAFFPEERVEMDVPSIYYPGFDPSRYRISQYKHALPTKRDLKSPLHRARDTRKVMSHGIMIGAQERIADRLGLNPGTPSYRRVRDVLLKHHFDSFDKDKAVRAIAKANNLSPDVVPGMLEQFATYGHLELHLTDLCNLNCVGCTYSEERKKENVLPFQSIAKLGELRPASIVVVGGGEPTLYKNNGHSFSDAIHRLTETIPHGLHIGLITNGVELPPLEDGWADHVRWMRISMDAATPETFERFRGRNRQQKVLNHFLQYLRETRIGQVGVSFLYSQENADEYAEFIIKVFDMVRKDCPKELPRVNIQFRPLRCPDPEDNKKYAVNKTQIDAQLGKLSSECQRSPELAGFVRRQTNAYAILGGNVHPLLCFLACRYSSVAGIVRATGKIITCFCKVGRREFIVGELPKLDLTTLGLNKMLMRTLLSAEECNAATCRMSFVNKVLEVFANDKTPKVSPPLDLLLEEKGV